MVYANPDIFTFKLIDVKENLLQNIRLTIDTEVDFSITQDIYSTLLQKNEYPTISEIVNFISQHPNYSEIMSREIDKNSK